MTTALGEIAACVFDAYGTLLDFNSAVRRGCHALGGRGEHLGQRWRELQLEYTWLRTLMGRHADYWQVTGEALDEAMAEQDLHDPGFRARMMELFLQ